MTAPAIRVGTYSGSCPVVALAVAGPTSLMVGSTARIAGAAAFHIARYWAGVRAGPQPAGWQGVSLARSGSFQSSQSSMRLAVPAGLVIVVPVSVTIAPLL